MNCYIFRNKQIYTFISMHLLFWQQMAGLQFWWITRLTLSAGQAQDARGVRSGLPHTLTPDSLTCLFVDQSEDEPDGQGNCWSTRSHAQSESKVALSPTQLLFHLRPIHPAEIEPWRPTYKLSYSKVVMPYLGVREQQLCMNLFGFPAPGYWLLS